MMMRSKDSLSVTRGEAGGGMKGYFTIPYAYLMGTGLASDFWTIRVVK